MALFELIQVAIGRRNKLTHPLSKEEWVSLRLECKKQALLGIGYVGITRLPKEQCPPIELLAQWVHGAEKIKRRNAEISEKCIKVCRQLERDGFDCVVLKGQSNIQNYLVNVNEDKPLACTKASAMHESICDARKLEHESICGARKLEYENIGEYRTPGDIDVWVWPKDRRLGYKAVIAYVHRAEPHAEVQYHHIDTHYGDTEVEVHFRASWLNCPLYDRRFQKWCEEKAAELHEGRGTKAAELHEGICDARRQAFGLHDDESSKAARRLEHEGLGGDFNAIYQLVHIYRHLFSEGIGLRQLLDYYFVLSNTDEEDRTKAYKILKEFGVINFTAAVMWVLGNVFSMSSEYMICAPDEKRGAFLLSEIMLAGNFGKYDERNVISANEGYLKRFIRRQRRFSRFLFQYPTEVIWGPYFTIKQRMWRIVHG